MRMSEMTDAYVKLDKVSKIYGTKEVKIMLIYTLMVYKSQKAASLYSEFANSKNL